MNETPGGHKLNLYYLVFKKESNEHGKKSRVKMSQVFPGTEIMLSCPAAGKSFPQKRKVFFLKKTQEAPGGLFADRESPSVSGG
jgi:hypothetical protein